MIKNVHHNPNKFPLDMNKFYRYEKHLVELEGKLLDGSIYQVELNSTIYIYCDYQWIGHEIV